MDQTGQAEQLAFEGMVDSNHDASVFGLHANDVRMRDFALWVKHQTNLIAKRSRERRDSDGFLFAQAVKLGEEVGELNAQLLGRAGLQRSGKNEGYSTQDIGNEIADVMICAAIVAELVGVDVSRALYDKLEVINARARAADVLTLKRA